MRIPEHYAVVERSNVPDDSLGEAEIIEVTPSVAADASESESEPVRVRIDTVPQDTIAASPDAAATAAIAMQSLSHCGRGSLGFSVKYFAD